MIIAMKQLRVALIGHVCLDVNTSESASYVGWGSAVLYMSQYYRACGQLRPIVISSYGPDMLDHLPKVRVLPERPNRRTTLCYQNDSTQSKRVQHCYHLAESRPPTITRQMKLAVQQADIIVVAPLHPNNAAK